MLSPTVRPVEPRRLPQYSQSQLNQFIDAHERFLTNQPRGRRALLQFLQAEQMDFSGRRLLDADFTGAKFRNANLRSTNFERASLFCADLTGADASQASFRRADLRGVSLRDARLEGANLDEADMREAILALSDASGVLHFSGGGGGEAAPGEPTTHSVDFTNCSMRKARLRGAKLKGANFAGALLEGADLEGANLSGANFNGAVLMGARLDRVIIDKGALEGCVVEPGPEALARVRELRTRLEAAESWIRSNGATGAAANLDDSDLRPLGAAFEGRRLTALSANRTCAIGVSFAGAQLQGARFEGADLRGADFSGADLRGASFRGADLHHVCFRDANVRGLPLGPGRVAPVDLTDTRYYPSVFEDAIQ